MEFFRNKSAARPKVPKALLEKKALFLNSIKTEQKKNAKLTLKVNQKCIGDIRQKNIHIVSGFNQTNNLTDSLCRNGTNMWWKSWKK